MLYQKGEDRPIMGFAQWSPTKSPPLDSSSICYLSNKQTKNGERKKESKTQRIERDLGLNRLCPFNSSLKHELSPSLYGGRGSEHSNISSLDHCRDFYTAPPFNPQSQLSAFFAYDIDDVLKLYNDSIMMMKLIRSCLRMPVADRLRKTMEEVVVVVADEEVLKMMRELREACKQFQEFVMDES
ncbi:unnamed protein product [Vicia faba]|uniref:Uncharacterized protein n=1 Tax=Vicia faba TaxID=3906 RepID=A0AAV0YPQ1_VICFA|nr:unnamed protein product [Vicia faba]